MTVLNTFLRRQAPAFLNYLLPMAIGIFVVSCQSDTDLANETINDALRMESLQNTLAKEGSPASDSTKLDIQTSVYTNPVKKVSTQEELIALHHVKTVKETYDDGWVITTYDKKGHKVSEKSDYSGKKTYSYEFDKNKRVTKEKTKFEDGTSFTYVYKYNEEGKLISKTFTDSDGKESLTMMEYNPELNTRKEVSSTGMDKEFYDNRGLRVRFESYGEDHKLMGYGEATYNEDGLKIKEVSSIIGMSTNDELEYNEAGQLLKQHRTGILDVYFMFDYNEKGLISQHKNIKNHKEEVTVYEYTYY